MSLIIAYRRLPPVMNVRSQIGDDDVNRLMLLVLRRHGTDAIGDLIAREWNVFAFDAVGGSENLM
jgi:hypothetical protein